MDTLHAALLVAALLCALVAGFLFAFAVVVMPGLKRLGDRDFLRAFQVINGVIQNGQPLFMMVWLGSAVTLIWAAVLGSGRLEGAVRWLLFAATAAYLLGLQLPTIAINIPLNNGVQALDLDNAEEGTVREARERFERRWNRWNVARTLVGCSVSIALLILLLRL